MHKLDVCGLSCPHPVLRVKEALEAGRIPLQVWADVGAPRENIKRMAEHSGYKVREESAEPGSVIMVIYR